jgi:hypothetical protein
MIRIIYAKLTSTGAYDVVAKTANIELAAARQLAETMQLGNLPFGVKIGEEFGYARPESGGHVIARYTTYGWNDGRPAPPMTDLLWLDDAEFETVRCNPFHVIPRSDDVYAELTELPTFTLPSVDAAAELDRIRALRGEAINFTSFVAGVLEADPLLIVDANNHAANVELLMLLLPPRLRPRLTFQTRTFQPPQLPRRVTAADAMHANLRHARWARTLPDDADSLPLNPANRFADLLASLDQLHAAHALYEKLDATDVSSSLANEAARVIRLADFLTMLDRKLITEAVRLIAKTSGSEAGAALQELSARFPAGEIANAVVALFESGADEPAVARILRLSAGTEVAQESAHTLCNVVLTTRRETSAQLAALLLQHQAASDVDRAVLLFAAARRPGSTVQPADAVLPADLARYIEAQSHGARSRPIDAALALFKAAAELTPRLHTKEARQQIDADCAAALRDMGRSVSLTAADVRALRSLQSTLDSIGQPWSDELAAKLFSESALARATQKDVEQTARTLAESADREWAGAVAAALLIRTAHANDADARVRSASAARAILAAHKDQSLGKAIAALLPECGVRDTDLLEESAFAPVLPYLGDTAREASFAQLLSHTLTRLFNGDANAPAELAAGVFGARASHQFITMGSRAYHLVKTTLQSLRERGLIAPHDVQAELALDLLSFASDPPAFLDLERAALGRNDAVTVRLRRLDRAISQAAAANDELLYNTMAQALETDRAGIDPDARERLREALGTAGLHRRLLDAFNSVIQR